MIENLHQISLEIASRCLARVVSGAEILMYVGGSGLLEVSLPSPSLRSERSWSSKKDLCFASSVDASDEDAVHRDERVENVISMIRYRARITERQ